MEIGRTLQMAGTNRHRLHPPARMADRRRTRNPDDPRRNQKNPRRRRTDTRFGETRQTRRTHHAGRQRRVKAGFVRRAGVGIGAETGLCVLAKRVD